MVNGMMAGIAGGMIMIMVFVIIKGITSAPEEPPTEAAGVVAAILPILIGLIIGLGVFITLSPGMLSKIREWFTNRKNSKELYQLLQYQALAPNDITPTLNLKLEPIEGTVDNPIQISRQQLLFSKEFSYYFTEKSKKYPMYKLVGLHNQHRNLNCIYLIGKDTHTEVPYLLRLPPDYISKDLDECIRWCIQAGQGDIIKEV